MRPYHGGVFRYDNGTGTWAAVNSGFSYDPSKWYALELTSIGNTLCLYTVGIGMWYNDVMRARLDDLYAGFLTVPSGHKPGSGGLSQNYPNPFTSSTRIIYRVNQAAFGAGGLPAGIYCCRLQAGKTTGTIKMILSPHWRFYPRDQR